jgi:uncharacterized protein YabE (DUF348 family)
MSQQRQVKKTKRLHMDIGPISKPPIKANKKRPVKTTATFTDKTVKSRLVVNRNKSKKIRLFQRLKSPPLKHHPFLIPVITFILLSFFVMAAYVVSNGSTLGPSDTKLVHLKVDDDEQTVPTRAKTIQDLLKKLDISVGDLDIVEPALDTEIINDETEVKVYKARPITIIDGDKEVSAVAAGPTPRDAVARAGINIYPEDKLEAFAETIATEDVVRGRPVAQRFIIDRATPGTINLYGSNIPIRTHVSTVGEAIKEKNIQTQPDDVITPHPDTPLVNNAQIFITRVGTAVEAREEEIPMPVETVEDPALAVGKTVVRQKGSPGRKVVTYQVQFENDKEIGRTPIQEIVAVAPVTEIIVKGTKQPTIIVAGDHASLMLAAGIPASQHASAEYIISRESGWRLDARNSGGCLGLGQACPGSKLINACPNYTNDADCQLRFFTNYVNGRYGSWNGAYNFWSVNHWY